MVHSTAPASDDCLCTPQRSMVPRSASLIPLTLQLKTWETTLRGHSHRSFLGKPGVEPCPSSSGAQASLTRQGNHLAGRLGLILNMQSPPLTYLTGPRSVFCLLLWGCQALGYLMLRCLQISLPGEEGDPWGDSSLGNLCTHRVSNLRPGFRIL